MIDHPITIWRGLTFGPLKIYAKDALGNIYTLAGGWSVFASVKKDTKFASLLNLAPTITNTVTGEITIELLPATTLALPECTAFWDLVLQTPIGQKLGPYIGGAVTIKTPITQP